MFGVNRRPRKRGVLSFLKQGPDTPDIGEDDDALSDVLRAESNKISPMCVFPKIEVQ